jgi:aminoglycoside phosphotransferase family enzyme/predicted kinase
MGQKLISRLLSPSIYPETTRNVSLIQTHISFIFLTDDFVYKIKKPVDLGFLNFTTLDRRRFYCEEEVRLNRRLCPDVYLGVVQLRESAEGISFYGSGKIVEYAVKMRRLPEDRMLDRLLKEDNVTEDHIRSIATTIGEFHFKAERSAEIDRYGDVSIIKHNWDENFRQTAGFVGITINSRDMALVEEWVYRFLSDNELLFSERVTGGFIRDCDGDIHAENICLGDKVYIFDCIEFNERFRYIDTAADLAFLLMDFDYHSRKSFAEIALNKYLDVTGDSGMLRILDFYKIYRAFVRGKVESFKLNDRSMSEHEKSTAREKAIRHFRLARGYILRKRLKPGIILFCGLMGTGKSTLASELSFELGLDHVRSDVVRKKLVGMPANKRDLSEYGSGIYSEDWTRATYDSLLSTAGKTLEAGRGIILDASFVKRTDRDRFRQLAKDLDVPCFVINTACPEDLVKQRMNARILDTAEPSDGRWELYHLQKNEFESIADHEGKMLTLDTSGTIYENLETLLDFLELR